MFQYPPLPKSKYATCPMRFSVRASVAVRVCMRYHATVKSESVTCPLAVSDRESEIKCRGSYKSPRTLVPVASPSMLTALCHLSVTPMQEKDNRKSIRQPKREEGETSLKKGQ